MSGKCKVVWYSSLLYKYTSTQFFTQQQMLIIDSKIRKRDHQNICLKICRIIVNIILFSSPKVTWLRPANNRPARLSSSTQKVHCVHVIPQANYRQLAKMTLDGRWIQANIWTIKGWHYLLRHFMDIGSLYSVYSIFFNKIHACNVSNIIGLFIWSTFLESIRSGCFDGQNLSISV